MLLIILIALALLISIELIAKKDYITPFMLLLLSILMAVLMFVLNYDAWEVRLNYTFLLYLSTAVLSFAAGCVLVDRTTERVNSSLLTDTVAATRDLPAVRYPVWPSAILSVICMTAYVYLMLRNVDTTQGITTTLRNIYDYVVESGNNGDFVMHQFIEIVIALAKVNVFAVFYEKYINKGKIGIGYLIPVGAFFICMIVSTDRNIFIRFVLYAICIWILFYTRYSKHPMDVTNRKIFFRTMLCIAAVAIVFFALGKMKNYKSNLSRMLGTYAGSGLYNFNMYIEDFHPDHLYHGRMTFSILQNTLKTLGLSSGATSDIAKAGGYITFTSKIGYKYSSNIYSAMRTYVDDFGYFGVILFPFVLGSFYEFLYNEAKNAAPGFFWILYSLLMYSVVYFSIAEQFFLRLHLGIVYEIGWVAVFYYLFFNRNRNVICLKERKQ